MRGWVIRRKRPGRAAFGDRGQAFDRIIVVARRFGAVRREAHQDELDPVDGGKHRAHQFGAGRERSLAHPAQHFLRRVRHALQTRETKKAAGTLDRVHQPEHQPERGRVVRRAFQLHQGDVELGDAFSGFGQELGNQVVHGTSTGPRLGAWIGTNG